MKYIVDRIVDSTCLKIQYMNWALEAYNKFIYTYDEAFLRGSYINVTFD